MNDMSMPWLDEPDFKKWIDPETGLLCAIVRNRIGGNLCGYVRLPHGKLADGIRGRMRRYDGHFFGRAMRKQAYSHPKLHSVSVHGGLTFGGRHYHHRLNRGIWLGFDCAHYGDLAPAMAASMPSLARGAIYRDFGYVASEVKELAKQLLKVSQ